MVNKKNSQLMLIGCALVFRENKGKKQYLIVKHKEGDDWEIAKTNVRRGESSVRSVIRFTGEQCGMNARVLEEAGRSTGSTVVNGKPLSQKFIYYLMIQRTTGGEIIGFDEFSWVDLPGAIKKVASKKEKEVFKDSKAILKEWEKTKKHKMEEEEESFLAEELSAKV